MTDITKIFSTPIFNHTYHPTMKKILTGAVALCLALPPLAAQNTSSDVTQNNPFLQEYTTPYQIPPFSLIKNCLLYTSPSPRD